jgi:hypothetical protein
MRLELRKAQGRDGLSAIPVAPVKAESDLELIASGAACSDHRPGFKGAPFARLNLEQFGTKAAGDTCGNFHRGFPESAESSQYTSAVATTESALDENRTAALAPFRRAHRRRQYFAANRRRPL